MHERPARSGLGPFISAVREPAPLSDDARARVMAAVRDEPVGFRQRLLRGLARERSLRMSVLGTVGLAAGLLGIGVAAGWLLSSRVDAPIVPVIASGVSDPRVVNFVLVAPGAQRVSLVGDFNGWDPGAMLMQRSAAEGVWSLAVPLAPGRHLYAFVVDEEEWRADPTAPLAPDDGYGKPNSVLTIDDPIT